MTYHFHLGEHGNPSVNIKLLFLWCISYFYHMYMALSVKYVVFIYNTIKSVGYVGRAVVPGVVDQGTSLSHQGPEDSALLTDLHGRCKVLLTEVSECGWHELDDRYIDECMTFPQGGEGSLGTW